MAWLVLCIESCWSMWHPCSWVVAWQSADTCYSVDMRSRQGREVPSAWVFHSHVHYLETTLVLSAAIACPLLGHSYVHVA